MHRFLRTCSGLGLLRPAAAVLAPLLVAAVAACGSDDGPASFVGRASNAVVYMTWTRSQDSLSGQLTQALADADASTGTVNTDRVSFDGKIAGKSVSITLNQSLGSSSTLTGTLDGDTLAVDYPGTGGGITTIKLRKGDSAAYNGALAALRDKTTQAKQNADQAAADRQAREQASRLADGVRAAIAGLDQAADNATANGPDLYQSDLDTVSSDLDTVKSSYELVTEDQQNGYGDTICGDASTVGDDVDNMKSDISSIHSDVKTTGDTSVLRQDIDDLRQKFTELQALDPALLPGDAPTQDDIDAGIRAARRKVRSRAGQGASFAKAQALLLKAQAIKAKADAACNAHGGG